MDRQSTRPTRLWCTAVDKRLLCPYIGHRPNRVYLALEAQTRVDPVELTGPSPSDTPLADQACNGGTRGFIHRAIQPAPSLRPLDQVPQWGMVVYRFAAPPQMPSAASTTPWPTPLQAPPMVPREANISREYNTGAGTYGKYERFRRARPQREYTIPPV